MKEKVLWIVLFILIILATSLTITVHGFKKSHNNSNNENNAKIQNKNNISYWISYKDESYDSNGVVYDYSDADTLIIKLENNTLVLCSRDPEKCEAATYQKKGNEYIVENNKEIEKANLKFIDAYDEKYGKIIQIIKYNDEEEKNHTIFYLKKGEQ